MRIDERAAERGAALAAVLMAITLLLPLGALAVLQARVGFLTQQSLRGDAEALHAADAALACALAQLHPGTDLEALPHGPDGIVGTADDGNLPFGLACGLSAADVRVEDAGADAIVLVSTGRGSRGAVRCVERRLWRAAPDALATGGWRERDN